MAAKCKSKQKSKSFAADPVLEYLHKQCRKRGLKDDGTLKVTLNRLKKYEEQESKKKSKKTIKKGVTKEVTKNKLKKIKTLYSTEKKPLRSSYSAQDFIQDNYKGMLDKAKKHPEWRVGSGGKMKLMVPDRRNTKGGIRVRWVLFKE
tara:strand:- start:216 stop:656 length:441 start_codon:yes stop_codon:yes gene_type:complete